MQTGLVIIAVCYALLFAGLVLLAMAILIGVCVTSPMAPVEFVWQLFGLPQGNSLWASYNDVLSALALTDNLPHGWPYTWRQCVRDQWMPYTFLAWWVSLVPLVVVVIVMAIVMLKELITDFFAPR